MGEELWGFQHNGSFWKTCPWSNVAGVFASETRLARSNVGMCAVMQSRQVGHGLWYVPDCRTEEKNRCIKTFKKCTQPLASNAS